MRYEDSKQRSGELLRLALQKIGLHAAASNPLTYAVWYEFVAGTNVALNTALLDLEGRGAAIDDAAIEDLHRRFIASPDADMVEQAGAELRGLLQRMAASAMDTGGRARDFGHHLENVLNASVGQSGDELMMALRGVLTKTSAMRSDVVALEQRLQASQAEIENLHAALDRARREATLDPLSGLVNRGGFDRALAAVAADSAAAAEHALVMFDIDLFKQVNDKHGHLAGDRVIQAVAAALLTAATDTHCTAARYGGEEFALILPRTTRARAEAIAQDVLARVRALRFRSRSTGSVAFTVTVSAGLAAWRAGETAPSWIARADAALYRSKAAGRDRLTGD